MKRLNIQDMPSDPQGCLKGLRRELCAVHNYTRDWPEKYTKLLEVLERTVQHMKDAQKEQTKSTKGKK